MKKTATAWAILILAVLTTSYVVAKIKTDNGMKATLTMESRPEVKNFSKIDIAGSPTVYFTQGNTYKVSVKARKNVMKYVRTDVKGKLLTVKIDHGQTAKQSKKAPFQDGDVEVYVTAPSLTSVNLAGSGDFKTRGKVTTDRLSLTLAGSGDIDFDGPIVCNRISGRVVGSGDLDIKQVESRQAEWTLVGSGDVEVDQRKVEATSVSLQGSGDMKIGFSDCGTADCQLVGSGDITLRGQLRSLNKKMGAGSGDYHTGKLRVGE